MTQKTSLIIQIITTIVSLLMILPAGMNVIAGLMGMAAEGGSTAWQVVAGAVTLLSLLYPLAALISVVVSWILYLGQNYQRALHVSLIPGGWVVIVAVLMGVLFGVIEPSI